MASTVTIDTAYIEIMEPLPADIAPERVSGPMFNFKSLPFLATLPFYIVASGRVSCSRELVHQLDLYTSAFSNFFLSFPPN